MKGGMGGGEREKEVSGGRECQRWMKGGQEEVRRDAGMTAPPVPLLLP